MPSRILFLLLAGAVLHCADLDEGWEHFYNLEFNEAIQEFERTAAGNGDSPAAFNHLAQANLYRAMMRAGALESELVTGGNSFLRREKVNPTPEEQKQFDDCIARSMELSRKRINTNPKDIDALYLLGVAHGLRANYNFLVRKAWIDALRDATEARRLHNRVTQMDPSRIDPRLVQGMHDYIVGSLPWTYRWFGFLIGFHGNKSRGIEIIKLVAEKGERNRYDAQIALAVIYRRERRPADAVPLLASLIQRFPRNYIFHLELVQMYSDLGKKGEALAVLANVERMKEEGTPGFRTLPYEKIYYFRGNLQFWYNDLDEAIENLTRVTAKAHDLDMNTGVLAWMRLGQTYDLKGQRQQAVKAYRAAVAFAPGSAVAKESEGYIGSPYKRPKKS